MRSTTILCVRREDSVVMAGDGQGGLRFVRELKLPGAVTAMLTGEIDRADGLADLILGIRGESGSALVMNQGARGALESEPTIIRLPHPAKSMALGDLDGDSFIDLVAAAGRQVVIVRGMSRQGDPGKRAPETLAFPNAVDAVAIGDLQQVFAIEVFAFPVDCHLVSARPLARRIECVDNVIRGRKGPLTCLIHQESDVLRVIVLIPRNDIKGHPPKHLPLIC